MNNAGKRTLISIAAEVSVTIRDESGTVIGRDWIHKSFLKADLACGRADAVLTSYQIGKIPNLHPDSLIRITT